MELHLPDIPVSDPVLIFALAMAMFLVVPLLSERLRVPGLIGLIVIGAAVGPNGLGILARDHTMVLLGTVGLLYLMFLVGLELDLNEFNRHRSHSIVFGLSSFALPQVLGTSLSLALGYSLGSSLLLGAMFASHTLVAYPIASRLGIVKTRSVTTVLGATLITDLLALLVLAIVSRTHEGSIGPGFWASMLGSLAVYVALVLWGLPKVGRWFFRRVHTDGPTEYVFTLTALFALAYLAHVAGIEPIIGALLAGFALNRLIPEHSALMSRIKFVAEAVFVPFFLLSVGMLVDVRAFADPDAWLVIGALVSATVVSKGIAAWVTRKLFGYASEDGWVMFGLSVSHAAATMAIVLVGYEIGLFDETIVNAVVVIILVTCIIGPWAVTKYGRRVAIREEQRPYEPSAAPTRILIPISHPKTCDTLLDLAFIVRTDPGEPIHPLMVVREDGDGTEAQVAEAERMLSHAVLYAAGADVPVTPLTRVDQNIASGIARGATETRSSIIVIGWDGGRSSRYGISSVFGGVLDQVLEHTRQMVMVAKLGHPLNITTRLVVLVPAGTTRHPGFYDAARVVKVVASQLGAPVLALLLGEDAGAFSRAMGEVKPEVPVTVDSIPSWSRALSELERRLEPTDLVVVMSARRGMVSWHPKLERLPQQLARLVPESFVVLYPGQRELGREQPRALPEAPSLQGLAPARVVRDLPEVAWDQALRLIIGPSLAGAPEMVDTIVGKLVDSSRGLSVELRPGVVVPHASIDGVSEPTLFLGVSAAGVAFPGTSHRAHLVFVLLSPRGRPVDHLRSLAELARLAGSDAGLREVLRTYDVDVAPLLPALPRAQSLP